MEQPQTSSTRSDFARVLVSFRQWWRQSVVGTVNQAVVISERREDCSLSARYLFMLAMSAAIAVLGLLLSSPAVVIGAMLLSPLMGPIIGLGFALAVGDFGWLRDSARSLAIGTVLAVGLCALIVAMSPIQTVTTEIASRTKPNLFDLGVAFFSALAGAYAMIRGRQGTVVGVAIATALMPPLAVVGFGLATLNWTVFSGALMLYVTNLLTIAAVAAGMARLYGFRTSLSERQTQLQTFVIVVSLVALAIPLSISLRQIAWETQASRTIRGEIMQAVDRRARLSDLEFDWRADPIEVAATVLTPRLSSDAEARAERALASELGREVDVTITQYRVGTSAQAAEEAQLAAARANEAAARERAEDIADRLALVAGVEPDDVLVDRERRRASVKARELDGASLSAYRELEARIAGSTPKWRIELRPPARPLPDVALADGEPTDEGRQAVALIVWATRRVDAPIELSGTPENVAVINALLAESQVNARTRPGGAGEDTVEVNWAAPGE